MKQTISVLLLVLLFACQRTPVQPPLPKRAVDLATTGIIRGIVTFEGTTPAPMKIPVASFRDCVNSQTDDPDVLIRDGKVQNAFVYLKDGLEDYAFPVPEGEVVLDQKGCLYEPRVVGLRVGQTLVLRNDDPVLHNVHALPKRSRFFNVAMPKGAAEIRKSFDEPEVMVPIRCDVHPWMRAYVGVLPHPYFAVTGPDGTFELKNVPPGVYTLEAWHERLGTLSRKVSSGVGKEMNVVLTFTDQ
jgi:plastocyanin